jgi:hypothetical protein
MKPADRRPADRLMVKFPYSGTAAITLLACDHSLSAPQTRLPWPSRKPHAGVGTPGERPVAIRPRRSEGSGSHFARHLAVNRWRRIGPGASISIGLVFRPAIGIAVNPFASPALFDDFRASGAAFGWNRPCLGLLGRRYDCLGLRSFPVRSRRSCVFGLLRLCLGNRSRRSLLRLRLRRFRSRRGRNRLLGRLRLRLAVGPRRCGWHLVSGHLGSWRHRSGRLFCGRCLLLRRR